MTEQNPPTLLQALAPLVAIADAYDSNDLDDEARKFWGGDDQHKNTTPPEDIEIYQGRGGRCLLTLADALNARAAILAIDAVPHPDDVAVDKFAAAMKAKMARSRDKGRYGWDDPDDCSDEDLAEMFRGHLMKSNPGNFEDLACLLMMLSHRGADLSILNDIDTQTSLQEQIERYDACLRNVCFHLELGRSETGCCDNPQAYDNALSTILAAWDDDSKKHAEYKAETYRLAAQNNVLNKMLGK